MSLAGYNYTTPHRGSSLTPLFCQVCVGTGLCQPISNLVAVSTWLLSPPWQIQVRLVQEHSPFNPCKRSISSCQGWSYSISHLIYSAQICLFCTKYKAVTKQFPQGCLVVWFWFSGFLNFVLCFLIIFFTKITNNTLKLFIFEKNMMQTCFLKISALYYIFKGINTVERSTICKKEKKWEVSEVIEGFPPLGVFYWKTIGFWGFGVWSLHCGGGAGKFLKGFRRGQMKCCSSED